MWKEGSLRVNGDIFHYWMKQYDEGSKWGINGGRISKSTALIGNIMNIKPVLHMNPEGQLVSLQNVRGRKKALQALVDHMAEARDISQNRVFLSHGDCPEDAAYVEQMIRERFGITDITCSYIGPAIGSHSGPGTVALFYFGNRMA